MGWLKDLGNAVWDGVKDGAKAVIGAGVEYAKAEATLYVEDKLDGMGDGPGVVVTNPDSPELGISFEEFLKMLNNGAIRTSDYVRMRFRYTSETNAAEFREYVDGRWDVEWAPHSGVGYADVITQADRAPGVVLALANLFTLHDTTVQVVVRSEQTVPQLDDFDIRGKSLSVLPIALASGFTVFKLRS